MNTDATWIALFVVALGFGACLGWESPSGVPEPFFSTLLVRGDEVEQYGSLKEMAGSADLVVRGRFVDYELSREFIGETGDDVVVYAKAAVHVDEVVRGEQITGEVDLEFLIPRSPAVARSIIRQGARQLPKRDHIFFLRAKQNGTYRLVNSAGLWAWQEDSLRAPMSVDSEHPALAPRVRFQRELNGLTSIDGLSRKLRHE